MITGHMENPRTATQEYYILYWIQMTSHFSKPHKDDNYIVISSSLVGSLLQNANE